MTHHRIAIHHDRGTCVGEDALEQLDLRVRRDRDGHAGRSAIENAELIGGIQEVLVEGRNHALGQWIGRTSCNRTLNFSHPGGEEEAVCGALNPDRRPDQPSR